MTIRALVESFGDAYVAYPLNVEGGLLGEGDSPEAALDALREELARHFETGADRPDEDDVPAHTTYHQFDL